MNVLESSPINIHSAYDYNHDCGGNILPEYIFEHNATSTTFSPASSVSLLPYRDLLMILPPLSLFFDNTYKIYATYATKIYRDTYQISGFLDPMNHEEKNIDNFEFEIISNKEYVLVTI